jgi:hypothetical protein
MERSRWLKTSVRNLVHGDLLFIDCDTLITCSLNEIENFEIDFGAVLDSHMLLTESHIDIYNKVYNTANILEWDISKGNKYFNSGVIYVKDTKKNRLFFEKWHSEWLKGMSKGISIDQPSLAKVNIQMNYQITEIEGIWNSLVYTQSEFVKDAKILHFWSFRNMSYVFSKHFLEKVRNEGVKGNEFIQYSILHPHETYLPFDNSIFHYQLKNYLSMILTVSKVAKLVHRHLNGAYDDYISTSGIDSYLIKLFKRRLYFTGAVLLAVYKFYRVKLNKKYKYVENTCSI